MIRLLVCDMAGTTVRDDGLVEAAFIDALAAVGRAADETALQHVRETMGQSKIEVFRALFDESDAQAANAAFEAAYLRHVGDVRPVEGAEALLGDLRSAGLKVALTTGFADPTREAILEQLGWADLVDVSLSPGPGRRGRPWPDLVLASLMVCEVDDVRQVAVVGDTASDVLSGTRAGASIVAGVLTGAHDRAALERAPHTHVLDSVADLRPLLL